MIQEKKGQWEGKFFGAYRVYFVPSTGYKIYPVEGTK